MGKRIITVSRQFGSGGQAVGQLVAERLGIAFYDREVIAKIAEKSGLDPDYIKEFGEYATSASSFLYNLNFHVGLPGTDIPIPDQLYVIQYNTITELAEKGPCVIVGRCADYILRERTDCLHIYLHADAAFRADRIVHLYGEAEAHPEKLLEEMDNKRKVYYKYYTNRVWGMAENYHLSLNSGYAGVEKCADFVVDLARHA